MAPFLEGLVAAAAAPGLLSLYAHYRKLDGRIRTASEPRTSKLGAIESGLGALVFHRRRRGHGWEYDFITGGGATLCGFAPSEIYDAGGLNEAIVFPEDRGRLKGASAVREFRIVSPAGETRWVREVTQRRSRASGADGTAGEVGILSDVTSAVHHRELSENAYKYDSLTHAYSRRFFEEAVDAAFRRYVADRRLFAVAVFDIEAFREINEVYGFGTGDELLREVARDVRAAADEEDVVARLGPDTFGILTEISTPAEAGALADALLARFGRHFDIAGQRLYVSISIGVVVSGDAEGTPANILRYADTALERAKCAGGRCIYSEELTAETIARAKLKDDLREAIAGEQFALVYQPKISLRTGEIAGCEALIRWNHPTRGFRSPNHFIPVAESSGLIVAMGEWVIRQACRQYAAWRDAGLKPVPVSVNVSAVQFARSDLPGIVERALRDSAVPPNALRIEITEGVMLDYSHECAKVLGTLCDMGIEIELDDFGTGYSSLAYLRKLPLSTLKIDRTFVHGALQDPCDAAIVSAIVALATKLGLSTIGEGAETAEQAAFLQGVGCDQVQGYFFSPPLNAEDFARFARGHSGEPNDSGASGSDQPRLPEEGAADSE